MRSWFFLILIGLVLFGCLGLPSHTGPVKHNVPPSPSPSHKPPAKPKGFCYGKIRSAVLKPLNYDTFNLYMNFSSGLFKWVEVKHTSNEDYIAAHGLIHTEQVFLSNTSGQERRFFCLVFNGSRVCAEIKNDSFLRYRFALLQSLDPALSARKEIKELDVLNSSGGFVCLNQTLNNKANCFDVLLNYNVLTLDDLKKIGMLPSDPKLTYFSDYHARYCISHNGVLSTVALRYRFLGKPMNSSTTFRFTFSNSTIALPSELENESMLEARLVRVLALEREFRACKGPNTGICIKTLAVKSAVPALCDLAKSERDSCYLILARELGRQALCSKIQNHSLEDDCLLELGVDKKDASICEEISDQQKRTKCLTLLHQTG